MLHENETGRNTKRRRNRTIFSIVGIMILMFIILLLCYGCNYNDVTETYTIVLNGEKVVMLNIGDEYEEEGVSFLDSDGNKVSEEKYHELEKELSVYWIKKIDTSVAGKYCIIYKYTRQELKREVIVREEEWILQIGEDTTTTAKITDNPEESTTIGSGSVTTYPSETTNGPVEIITQPGETTTGPVEIKTQPGEVTTSPVEITTQPSEITTGLAETTTYPRETTTGPVEIKTQPGETTTSPVETTTSSTEVTTSKKEDDTSDVKHRYDMSGVSLNNAVFDYDGTSKGVYISGRLPEGVTVSYEGNGKIDAGVYTVVAHFTGSGNYYPIDDMSATLTINKATLDMSHVTFEDTMFTYDGKAHSIYISGILPLSSMTVSYTGNGVSKVGTYTVTASFGGYDTKNYNAVNSISAKIIIISGNYNMSGVSFSGRTFDYDGKAKNIYISGTLPEGVTVSYEGNGQVNAGVYTVIAHFKGSDNYTEIGDMSATLTINKATLDMSQVTFEDKTFTYDGMKHSISISGILPLSSMTVSYTGNGVSKVGTYTVTASFGGYDTKNYNAVNSISAKIIINKGSYNMSGVLFRGGTFTYDGSAQSISISGRLPEGVTVSYEGNGQVDAGTYTVVAHFTGSSNYNPIDDMSATLTINKATLDMSQVNFEDKTFTYDGMKHSISISGSLPLSSMTVSYTGNGVSEVGTYTVTASFGGYDTKNYNTVEDMSATLTINKATLDMSQVNFEDKTFTYDGMKHSISISGSLPLSSMTVSYTGNGVSEVGTYTVTASFGGYDTKNYNTVNSISAKIIINKGSYNMSGVLFRGGTFTYNGSAQSISISGTLPEGVSVSYRGNSKIDAGTYTVVAHFTGSSNYNPIEDMSATLTINKATLNMSGVTFSDIQLTEDGQAHSISISGSLPLSSMTVSYIGNGVSTVGTHTVTAIFSGYNTNNYYSVANMYANIIILAKPNEGTGPEINDDEQEAGDKKPGEGTGPNINDSEEEEAGGDKKPGEGTGPNINDGDEEEADGNNKPREGTGPNIKDADEEEAYTNKTNDNAQENELSETAQMLFNPNCLIETGGTFCPIGFLWNRKNNRFSYSIKKLNSIPFEFSLFQSKIQIGREQIFMLF